MLGPAEVHVRRDELLQHEGGLGLELEYGEFVVSESFLSLVLEVSDLLELVVDVFFVQVSLLVDHPGRED